MRSTASNLRLALLRAAATVFGIVAALGLGLLLLEVEMKLLLGSWPRHQFSELWRLFAGSVPPFGPTAVGRIGSAVFALPAFAVLLGAGGLSLIVALAAMATEERRGADAPADAQELAGRSQRTALALLRVRD